MADIKEYFFINAIVYFAGFCLYVLMYRGGSIHCLHRFIISSPYFLVFMLGIAEWSKERKKQYFPVRMDPPAHYRHPVYLDQPDRSETQL